MGAGRIVAIIVICVIIGAGTLFVLSLLPGEVEPDTMTIKFTAIDKLAGSQDATTSKVDIYRFIDGEYTKQETVTMDTTQKESGLTYTTGEMLYFVLDDGTDTSICDQYLKWLVPQGTPAQVYDGSFQCRLDFIDRGDTAYDILLRHSNGTAITASGTLDVTNGGWDSAYAELRFELRNTNDDTGYKNTYNFLKDYDNNHYIVFSASGTGYDSVNLLTTSTPYGPIVGSYERGSVFYWVVELSDDAITRDKLSEGSYDPSGTIDFDMTFDLTGFTTGDSVTFSYMYKYFASWDYFQETGNWGTNSANNPTAESVTIQY